jgi:predicted ATP-grasp superfamily ATP-dependent carboligase
MHSVNHNNEFLDVYKKCLEKVNSCFIIAPEFSNILYMLTEIALNFQKKVYSIGLDGIKLGTSKLKTYQFFKNNHLNTPLTFEIPKIDGKVDMDFIYEKFIEFNHPFIIKPEDGVGAESIYYFQSKKELEVLNSERIIPLNNDRKFILQEYIEGSDFSVSLINKSILSINYQNVKFKNLLGASYYLGGYTPIEQYAHIEELIKKDLANINLNQFNSYFGIDFIKTVNDNIYYIEINPRLTTSYIGIRNILDQNPLKLLQKGYKRRKPPKIRHNGFSEFLRKDLEYTGKLTLNKINEQEIPKLVRDIPELVTPPIYIKKTKSNQNLEFSCFITTKSKDQESSNRRLSKIFEEFKINQFNPIR